MQERTKKLRTKQVPFRVVKDAKTISADEHIADVYGETPRWAIALAGLRYREGLTQKELGEMLGIKQSNISLMERGKRPIGKGIAKRLGEFFSTDYKLFL